VARIYEGRETSGYPRNSEPRRRHDPAENSRHHEQGARPGDDQNNSAPQFVEDGRAANYANDASGWVRGCKSGEPTCNNESAEHKPFFDKKQAYRTDRDSGMRDQQKYYADADSNRHHSQFEHRHNAGTTHVSGEGRGFAQRHVPNYEKRLEYGYKDSAPKHTGGWLRDKQ
jgi:hypothetical protein